MIELTVCPYNGGIMFFFQIAKSHNDRIYRGCYVEPSSGPNLCKVEGNICCDSDYCNTAALVASNNYTKMLALVVAGLFAHIRF